MRLTSIRSRLLAALSFCAALVIIIGSGMTYTLVRAHVYEEFDHFLKDKLLYHQISAVQNAKRPSFLISQPVWERIHDPEDPEYFQFRFEDGRSVYHSYGIADSGEGLPLVGFGDDAMKAHDCVLPDGRQGRAMGVVFTVARKPDETEPPMRLHLVVARDREGVNAALGRLRLLLVGAGGVATILALGATLFFVRGALRPMGDLSAQIAAMPVGGEGERFDLPRAPDEIAPVVDRLNELLVRVDGAIEHERQFTSNAAHELRNPLAGLRSQLELALGSERDPEADDATLARALKIQRQMEGVVDNLLALARLDAGRERLERQSVSLPEVLRRCWKPFFEVAAERGLKVRWDLDEAPREMHTAPALLDILVSNLFDNATSYVPDGGTIEIGARMDGERCRIEVANSNPGVSEEDLKTFFKRFGRGDSSAAGGRDHAGIGLSLCERIVHTLGGEIAAEVDRELFRIGAVLPAAPK